MIRFFQFAMLILALSLVALVSAIVTMRFAIHGAEVKLPNFKGMTAQEAEGKAAELGVQLSIDNRFYSAEVPAGRVLSQSPAPGTVVRREWQVRAIESLGPQLVAIPNLVGQPERAASIQIRRLGLELGAVAHLPSASAPPDTVIAQDPGPGAAGVETPTIGIVLSAPAPASVAAFVMPDFTGQPYATAAATISRAGLETGPAIQAAAPDLSANRTIQLPGAVVAQSPEAGYRVDANTAIELTVSR
jgi:beta-lactam-binding protein with PASTA domain